MTRLRELLARLHAHSRKPATKDDIIFGFVVMLFVILIMLSLTGAPQ